MSVFKKLFQQTFIYGLATVLPRALAIVLVPLYVEYLAKEEFGIYASLMAFLILGNVVLSYGMETAFFRFINKEASRKKIVQSTALTSLTVSSLLFLVLVLPTRESIASFLEFDSEYITYGLIILTLDALCVLPFVWYRANERPMQYAVIKILNVVINLGCNLFFFLVLPSLASNETESFWNTFYSEENKLAYIFIANLIASACTLVMVLPVYFKIQFKFDHAIWKQMLRYAFPVLIAGIAFSINEAFDKILLKYLLPADIAEAEVGVYAACYKLGVFMTLFATAFRLGIEPFFFNHAENNNAKQTYATITKYFTIFGSCILLIVVVYIDVFKKILIPEAEYWVALSIVPIILLANLCLGIYHNLSVWYKVTDRTRYGAYISVFGAIITLVLNFVLIPILSYMGSAIATLAAYGTMMTISYFFGRKYYKVPYNLKRIGSYLLIAVSFSLLSFYVFEGNLIAGTLLLLVFLLLIVGLERKEVQRIIRR
ncbi:lipopolysaccharide biosynthesis protein [Cochleicola gelatinilyticus]|uniref:Polysaccharide biosynthesis protein n=1 Tax=Cochleicola gelatinilyticus TaxID=1763537 RepID=A0A167J0G7_9FLAO|nr:oligosaccharide flippase family protein [Cochleicola gelatinilyticus]OAB80198.1 polysaccharide biosynthesis protein [Cochleicola gelatinilyticus]